MRVYSTGKSDSHNNNKKKKIKLISEYVYKKLTFTMTYQLPRKLENYHKGVVLYNGI